MNIIPAYYTLRILRIVLDGPEMDVMSPSHGSFSWRETVGTAKCPRCGDGKPAKNCTCGIYSVFDNGLHELKNYIKGPDYICVMGLALGELSQVYRWGIRSGQWVVHSVVDWHGDGGEMGKGGKEQKWWRFANYAVEYFTRLNVASMQVYPFDTACEIVRQQRIYCDMWLEEQAKKEAELEQYSQLFKKGA